MKGTSVMEIDSLRGNDLARIEAQLLKKFSPPLRPEEVERCLVSCITMFESAPVRNYLTLLIQRAATDRLSIEARVATEVGMLPAPPNAVVELAKVG